MKRFATAINISACLLLASLALTGCDPLARPEKSAGAPIKAEAMARYLAESKLERPQVVSAATGKVRRGEVYRERMRDQRGRWTLLTVWMDPHEAHLLHIMSKRDIDCPHCNGTGKRTSKLNLRGVEFMCRECKGTGVIKNHVEERKYLLANSDLEGNWRQKLSGRRRTVKVEEATPSPQAQAHIDNLVSDVPEERVEALRWLHANYLREDVFFNRFKPMLRKARWIESSEEKGLTVYQFWAARDHDPRMAYYRVYVDMKSGKIMSKGFISTVPEKKDPEDLEENLTERVEKVKDWFRWRKE